MTNTNPRDHGRLIASLAIRKLNEANRLRAECERLGVPFDPLDPFAPLPEQVTEQVTEPVTEPVTATAGDALSAEPGRKIGVRPPHNDLPAAKVLVAWHATQPQMSDDERYWSEVAVEDVLLQMLARPRFWVPNAWFGPSVDLVHTVLGSVLELLPDGAVPKPRKDGHRPRARLTGGLLLSEVRIEWDRTNGLREHLDFLNRALLYDM